MPKIKITEKNLTDSGLLNNSNNTVYIPGFATADTGGPILFTTSAALIEDEEHNFDPDCLSFKLATHLLNIGFYVLYEGFAATSVIEGKLPAEAWERLKDKTNYNVRFLTNGGFANEASFTPDSAEVSCAASRGDCIALLDHKKDVSGNEEDIYLPLINAPETWSVSYTSYFEQAHAFSKIASESTPTFTTNKYYVAKNNTPVLTDPNDFILLTSKPEGWDEQYTDYYEDTITYENIATGTGAPTFVINKYFKAIGSTDARAAVAAVRSTFSGITNGEYAAAFTPWFTTKNSELIDEDTGTEYIPASFGYLFAYAQSIKNNPVWYAAAGSQRGLIPELDDVLTAYSNAECEILQGRSSTEEVVLDDESDNNDFAINPIANIRPFGYIIWGNRTLLKPEVGALKATAFLNVRNLITEIKKLLFDTARKYTFDQNSDILWINFSSRIIPLLENMKVGNGILGYTFTRDKTDRKARLKASLVIVPIEGVEDFEFEIELKDSLNITNI